MGRTQVQGPRSNPEESRIPKGARKLSPRKWGEPLGSKMCKKLGNQSDRSWEGKIILQGRQHSNVNEGRGSLLNSIKEEGQVQGPEELNRKKPRKRKVRTGRDLQETR